MIFGELTLRIYPDANSIQQRQALIAFPFTSLTFNQYFKVCLQTMAPTTRSGSGSGSSPIPNSHARHSLASQPVNDSAQSHGSRRDVPQVHSPAVDNVPIVHNTPALHVQRMLHVRIPRKATVMPNRLLEERIIAPQKQKNQKRYQGLVTKHKYRLGSPRFRISRRIRDPECWEVLTRDTEVVGPKGCWVAKGTPTLERPFGSAANAYRVYHVDRKCLNEKLKGEVAYTHLAMNVMGFRWALKFTTIVGDVPQQFEVSHLCGHSHCYRPSHLVLDSHQVNLRRSRCSGHGCTHARGRGQKCFGHEECPEFCPERLKEVERQLKRDGHRPDKCDYAEIVE